MEKIGDLLLEHAGPSARARACPLPLGHGTGGGSSALRGYLMLEGGREGPFKGFPGWIDRAASQA